MHDKPNVTITDLTGSDDLPAGKVPSMGDSVLDEQMAGS